MVSISVSVDRKAALLRGKDLGYMTTVEVAPETIGQDIWPQLVAMLSLPSSGRSGPMVLPHNVRVSDNTAEAVRDALDALSSKSRTDALDYLVRLRGKLAELRERVLVEPSPRSLYAAQSEWGNGVPVNARYDGVERYTPWSPPHLEAITQNALTGAEREEIAAIKAEAEELRQASEAEIDAMNAAAWQAAKPGVIEAARVAAAERDAEIAAKQAALQATFAERLATGYWERETSTYNERRYGAPWCAKVTGVKERAQLVYEWGDTTAKFGHAGLMRLPCKPGDIIAWGQKDLRKPASSDHHIRMMEADGSMTEISQTDAYKLLTKKA
jgi:hypothetical protein